MKPVEPGLFELEPEELEPLRDVDGPAGSTHAEQARRFHETNPHVYSALVRLARYTKARGVKTWGIGAAWEVLRFKALETTGDIYKLNNNHRAWYSREIMQREPDLSGFFKVRSSPHDPDHYNR